MRVIQKALTFDDVLLLPAYSAARMASRVFMAAMR